MEALRESHDGEGWEKLDEETHLNGHEGRMEASCTTTRVVLVVVGLLLALAVVLFASIAIGVTLSRGCGTTLECLASDVLSNMDSSVNPCEDFYKYSCGGWERRYTISESGIRVTRFDVLYQKNVNLLNNVIGSGKDGDVPAVQLAKKFYDSCMDTGQLDSTGSQPLRTLIRQNGGWDLINVQNSTAPQPWSINSADFVNMHAVGNPAFFTLGVSPNPMNSSRHMAQVTQSGLTLGSADLYETEQQVTNLRTYITNVLNMLGSSSSGTQASTIVQMERELAKIFVSSDVRNPYLKYNPTTIQSFNTTWDEFNWVSYIKARFSHVGINVQNDLVINVVTPSYFNNLTRVYKKFSSSQWENYFKWQLVHKYLPFLGTTHLQAIQAFRQTTEGVSADSSRVFTCVKALQTVVPFTLARLYTKFILPNGTREQMSEMVTAIKTAFIEELKNNTWLDQQTIDASIDKVNAIERNVAYPEFVFNDTDLYERSKPIIASGGAFFDTNRNDLIQSLQTQLSNLPKPVDKNRWLDAPTQVNAFYSPLYNKFEFEEGILNSPFFVAGWPDYFKFGAIGMVAGHELTHGFDDQGHQYNKNGDLVRWWTNASLDAFNERAQCFVKQYSSYNLQGHQINGQRTLGENIADNGGLKTAYRAYKDSVNSSVPEVKLPSIDLTPDQLFFVAFSQLWCGRYSNNGLTKLISIDVHSPGPIRVLGTLSNSVEFAMAFNCSAKSRMNPVNKCTLW